MTAYIARFNEEQQRPRELIGFFFADDRNQLYNMIDECCDVDCCEVMALGPGGIYWDSSVEFVVPYPGEISEAAPGLPNNASVTDSWTPVLCNENKEDWDRVTWDA